MSTCSYLLSLSNGDRCGTYSGHDTMSQSNDPWTEPQKELTFSLWDEGVAASAISRRLGFDENGKPLRSRSAVISIVSRKHPNHERSRKTKANRRKTSHLPPLNDVDPRKRLNAGQFRPLAPPPPPVVEPIPDLTESAIPVDKRVKLADLETRDCRWPLGDDPRTDPDFGFCGCQQFMGVRGNANYGRSQYCLKHYRKSLRQEWRGPFEKALAKSGEVKSP